MSTNHKVSVSRDGKVTVAVDAGKVSEVKVDDRTVRWFHDASDHDQQMRGFGFPTRTAAAGDCAAIHLVTAREFRLSEPAEDNLS